MQFYKNNIKFKKLCPPPPKKMKFRQKDAQSIHNISTVLNKIHGKKQNRDKIRYNKTFSIFRLNDNDIKTSC